MADLPSKQVAADDCQLNWEDALSRFTDLETLDGTDIDAGTVALAALATDALNAFLKLTTAADREVAFGTTTVTCSSGGGSGAIAYGSASVTHGMGATPAYVLLTVTSGGSLGGGNVVIGVSSSSLGATTFTVNASALTPSVNNINGTVAVAWLAIA